MSTASNANLSQLRWQCIRAVEMQQTVEMENVALRKKIEEMQKENVRGAGTFAQKIAEFLKQTNESLQDTKSEMMAEKYGIMSEMSTVKEYLLKLQELTIADKSKLDHLRNENESLRMHNTTLQEQWNKHLVESSGKVAMNAEVLESLQKELDQARDAEAKLYAFNDELRQENERYKSEVTEIRASKEQILVEHAETQELLRSQLREVQQKYADDMTQNAKERQELIELKEREHLRLREEIAQLVCKLEDQEDYIQKLTSTLMGNKTNFAKFVELKTENAQLQTQLQKTKSKMKPRGGHQLLNTNPNTTTTNDNNYNNNKLLSSSGGRNKFNNVNVMEATARHEERVRQRASLPSPTNIPPFPSYDNDSRDPRDFPLSAPRPGYHQHLQGQTDYYNLNSLPMEDRTPTGSSRTTPRPHNNVEASEEEIRILAGYAESLRGKTMQSAPPPPIDGQNSSNGPDTGLGVVTPNNGVSMTIMMPATSNMNMSSSGGGNSGGFGGIGSIRGMKGGRGGNYQRQKRR